MVIGTETDLLIIEGRGRIKVAGCVDGQLVELGEVDSKSLAGYTITKYDGWDNCR